MSPTPLLKTTSLQHIFQDIGKMFITDTANALKEKKTFTRYLIQDKNV